MPTEHGEARIESRSPRAWSLLFRGFQLARDPYKIIIAAMAVVALTLGWWLLGAIFQVARPSANYPNQPPVTAFGTWPANVDRGPNPFIVTISEGQRDQLFTRSFWLGTRNEGPPLPVEPFRQFYQPVLNLFRRSDWSVWFYSFFGILWTLAVWALAAGAITRIAAVRIARNEQ